MLTEITIPSAASFSRIDTSLSSSSMKRSQHNFSNFYELELMCGAHRTDEAAATTGTMEDATKMTSAVSSITFADSCSLQSAYSYHSHQNYQSFPSRNLSSISCSCDEEQRNDEEDDRDTTETEFLPILYYDPERAVYTSKPTTSDKSIEYTPAEKVMGSSISSSFVASAAALSQTSFLPSVMMEDSCPRRCIEEVENINIIDDDGDEWGQFVDLAGTGSAAWSFEKKRNRIVTNSDHDEFFALVMDV